jgi:signal transduction histidine kinase
MARHTLARWELAVSAVAVLAAAIAVWATLRADFLAHPGWLALQKADFILGPVAVGLYWRRRRPESRLGAMLIAFGFVGALYTLQSSSNSLLFSLGVLWEIPIYVGTQILILAFPTGRLKYDWPERLILVAMGAGVASAVILPLVSPAISGEGSISGCRDGCPENALLVTPRPSWIDPLIDFQRVAIIAIAIATAGLLIWRFVSGSTPRRRALAVGAPVALLFLLYQATYQATRLFDPEAHSSSIAFLRWSFVGTRAGIWYGFWLSLLVAELVAARVLQRMVVQSLRRPSLRELEDLLRGPLGDPALRLGFWQPRMNAFVDAQGQSLEPPGESSRRALTVVEQNGRPAAAIVHDAELSADPELLRTAGATALLAYENAQLEAAWNESLSALRDSRARIAAAGDLERRKIEQNLHDGAQQALSALGVRIAHAIDLKPENPALDRELAAIARELDDAIDELRELAHGIYPAVLTNFGLVPALRSIQLGSVNNISVRAEHIGRYPPEIETALYYCCREALQNAIKHGGERVRTSVRVEDTATELRIEVRDDGPGFELTAAHDGVGLRNMEDRVAALDGHLEIVSTLGLGTLVSATIPMRRMGKPLDRERAPATPQS